MHVVFCVLFYDVVRYGLCFVLCTLSVSVCLCVCVCVCVCVCICVTWLSLLWHESKHYLFGNAVDEQTRRGRALQVRRIQSMLFHKNYSFSFLHIYFFIFLSQAYLRFRYPEGNISSMFTQDPFSAHFWFMQVCLIYFTHNRPLLDCLFCFRVTNPIYPLKALIAAIHPFSFSKILFFPSTPNWKMVGDFVVHAYKRMRVDMGWIKQLDENKIMKLSALAVKYDLTLFLRF